MEIWPVLILSPVLIIAAVYDIRFQRVPNWLNFSTAAAGVACHTYLGGLNGFILSVEGMFLGIALLVLFFIMGGMGAGDVKLLGAGGAFLGPAGVFAAFLIAGLTGGVYAVASLIKNGRMKNTLSRYGMILKLSLFSGRIAYIPPDKEECGPELHYAIPIGLGAVLTVFVPVSYFV